MLKERRKELGYTQEQVADLIGISLRQYARIDKEEDLPRRDVLKKIINIFKLSNDEIGKYIRTIVNKP